MSFPEPPPFPPPPPPVPQPKLVQWSVLDVVLAVLAGLATGFVLALVVGAALRDAVNLSGGVGLLLGYVLLYGSVALMLWALVLKRRRVSRQDVGLGGVRPGPIALMIPLTFGVLIMNYIVAVLTTVIFGRVPTAEDQLGVRLQTLTAFDFVCLFIVVVIIAPILEEIVFRGLLYRAIRARIGVASATVITALAFSAMHFQPLLLGVLFAFGVVLALVAEWSDSLYPPIVLHALNNSVAILLPFVVPEGLVMFGS
ncbi:MAG: CPBP family intramembrane metalloprotease [Actinomycetota bacterium]|nr:CPBP family intramembrane metalloprotease [Actinomycetota bacterium]